MNSHRHYATSRKRQPMSDINIVPYIDVMLVLLMVFMLTTPLLIHRVSVGLPKEESQQAITDQKNPIKVTVNKTGAFYLNIAKDPNKPIDTMALKNLVSNAIAQGKSKHESLPVFVQGDAQASYGQIVDAMVALQNAGADHVELVTQATQHSTD
jgi:biopolymer transport protein TolR